MITTKREKTLTRSMKIQPKLSEHEQFVLDVAAYLKAANIVVFNARIAVVRDPEDEVSKGGIIIPDEAKRKLPRGTVVGIGLGVEDNGVDVAGYRIGDRVMFTKYNPILFTISLPDGREANLELMHVSDLYLGWRMP